MKYPEFLYSRYFIIGVILEILLIASTFFIYYYINVYYSARIIGDYKIESSLSSLSYNFGKVKLILFKAGLRYNGDGIIHGEYLSELNNHIKDINNTFLELKKVLSKDHFLNGKTRRTLENYYLIWKDTEKPELSNILSDSAKRGSTKLIMGSQPHFAYLSHRLIIKDEIAQKNLITGKFSRILVLRLLVLFSLILFFFYYISKRDVEIYKEKELFDILLDHTTDIIAIKDFSGKYLKTSKTTRKFHVSPYLDSMLCKTDYDIKNYSSQNDEFFEELEQADKIVRETVKPYNFLLRPVDSDGKVHILDITKIPVKHRKESDCLYISVGHDITERVENEKRFKTMFYNNSLVMLIIEPSTANIIDLNDSAEEYYGYKREEIVGKPLNETLNPFVAKKEILFNFDQSIKNKKKNFEGYRHKLKNGTVRNVNIGISPVNFHDKQVFVITVIDVTDKLRNENKVKSLQALYESMIKEVSLILNPKNEYELFHRTLKGLAKSKIFTALWIGKTTKNNHIKYIASKGAGTQELMKIKLSTDCGKEFMSLSSRAICLNRIVYNNDHVSDPMMYKWKDFLIKNNWLSACSCPIKRDNGVWGVLTLISDRMGAFDKEVLEFVSRIGALLSHSLQELDIKKELEEEKKRVEYLAHHDTLTGLPNRLYLRELLEDAINRSDRNKTNMAVGLLDFDDFKLINDNFGHEAGDWLLKEFAARMSNLLRKTDHLVRLGGDEFVIIFEDLKSTDDLGKLISRFEKVTDKPFMLNSTEWTLNISLGISLYPVSGQNPEVLLVQADKAMYSVKSKKK